MLRERERERERDRDRGSEKQEFFSYLPLKDTEMNPLANFSDDEFVQSKNLTVQ